MLSINKLLVMFHCNYLSVVEIDGVIIRWIWREQVTDDCKSDINNK